MSEEPAIMGSYVFAILCLARRVEEVASLDSSVASAYHEHTPCPPRHRQTRTASKKIVARGSRIRGVHNGLTRPSRHNKGRPSPPEQHHWWRGND